MGDRSRGQGTLRKANQKRVLDLLRTEGPLTQAELARRATLSRSTVSSIVAELQSAGMVRNDPHVRFAPPRKPGRPGSLLSLDPSVGAVIGVDIDHERLSVLVADAAHTVLAEDHRTLERDHDAHDVMRLTSRLVARTVQRAGVKREQLAGAGVGLAGPVDLVTGRVHPSSIAPSWQFVDAQKELEALLELPVYIDNDANLGALAEMTWGVGRGVSEAAYVKVDTGVGVGIVVAGQIYRGATGTAGEIGHTTVDENGPVCRCGNRGCLEGLVGTAALVESLRTRYRADLTMDDVLRSAADGDVGCRRALADAGRQLGVQVANLCNLLNPRLVIIAGKLSEADEIVLEPLRTTFARHALPHAVETVEVVRAALGERATALGGAALAMHESGALIDIGTGPYPVGRPRPTERRRASPSWGAV
jgi:predicted NBD/HSP70 family sugar kinase/DNA-binding XRE family transcriptional regulator